MNAFLNSSEGRMTASNRINMTGQQHAAIVIVDEFELTRSGLAILLEQTGRFRVTGFAGSSEQALTLTRELQPDVVIITLDLAHKTGLELLRELKTANLPSKKLLLTNDHSELVVTQALAAGADAVVPKSTKVKDLIEALNSIRALSHPYLDRRWEHLRQSPSGNNNTELSDPLAKLSKRERQVFFLIVEGLPNRTIAKQLSISPRTIETHRARVIKKLGVGSTAELIRYAVRHKLIVA